MRISALFRKLLPKKIDVYIVSEVTGPLLGGMVFFSFVFLMFQVLRLVDFFIIHGVSALTLAKISALFIVSFLPMALPVAFLIAVLVAFGRLSADSELVAMKANGIGLPRLSLPVMVVALVVVVLSFGLNLQWVPQADRALKQTIIKVNNTKVVSSIKEGTFTSGFFDLLLFADKVNTKNNRLYRVFIYDEREPRNPLAVIAREGEVVPVRGNNLSAAIMLKLYRGNIHRNDIASNTYQKIDFGQYKLFLKIDEGDGHFVLKPRMIEYRELQRLIATTPKDSGHFKEYTMELWRRYALALSPAVFVFLGMGFGTIRTRAVRASAAVIAFVVILVYWALQGIGTVLVQKGYAPAFLAMAFPDLVMAVIAAIGFRRASW